MTDQSIRHNFHSSISIAATTVVDRSAATATATTTTTAAAVAAKEQQRKRQYGLTTMISISNGRCDERFPLVDVGVVRIDCRTGVDCRN